MQPSKPMQLMTPSTRVGAARLRRRSDVHADATPGRPRCTELVRSVVRGSRLTHAHAVLSTNLGETERYMSKVLAFVGASIGGWFGWWLGGVLVGMTTAFVLSIVGTAGGVYVGRRIARQYLE